MCRGCRIEIDGKSSCDEYLKWLDEYLQMTIKMKKLEMKLLTYQDSVDKDGDRKALDSFRRRLIRIRKEYAKAEELLNDV